MPCGDKGGCCGSGRSEEPQLRSIVSEEPNSTAATEQTHLLGKKDDTRVDRWTGLGLWACRLSIAWNIVEGGMGVYFGIQAHQLSLSTFGGQSLIEILAAVLVLYRFNLNVKHDDSQVYDRERNGTRVVGVCLFLLALISIYQALGNLWNGDGPDTSVYGAFVAGISAVVMGLFWYLKRRAGKTLQSSVMLSDAKCSLMCMMMGSLVFVSSVGHYVFEELWWLDAVCAVALSSFFLYDGVRIVKATYQPDFAGGCGCCQ